jgi:hypothetical protein
MRRFISSGDVLDMRGDPPLVAAKIAHARAAVAVVIGRLTNRTCSGSSAVL